MHFSKKHKKGLKKMLANNVKAISVHAEAIKALIKPKIPKGGSSGKLNQLACCVKGLRLCQPKSKAKLKPKLSSDSSSGSGSHSTAMVQTLSSHRRWQRELSVLLAQSPPQPPRVPPPVSPAGPIMGVAE
ncbi:hypothetical protein QTO34_014580 [Cnephaeus nilssonii]|uniref:60S ribosomal protein L29 n=1 Tax=Cnephaeus nilssonii TaxID=3371016 RepID=A0AA40I7U7_CNENI|nr:hypothetical protein QTO34_014580 [Eptesicus nilssonii]